MKISLGLFSSLTCAVVLLVGCESSKQTTETTGVTSSDVSSPAAGSQPNAVGPTMEKNGIRLTPFNDSPKMPEAGLRVVKPVSGAVFPSPDVAFEYEITNFQLTKMTGGQHMAQMANSMKGQHIHNIVDNEPYTAHYDTRFTKTLPEGRHVVLSFLSRSYHESLKHAGAYDLRIIGVGNVAPGAPDPINVRSPNLFYSRPKDTYAGADAKRIMLDFYLVNTTLEPDGNRVRATINGTEFLLDKWLPYQMEGLPAGENTVKLELLGSGGDVLPGAYNSVTRTFMITP